MKLKKEIAALVLAGVMAAGSVVPAFASAAPDGHTDAASSSAGANGAYALWEENWETKKNDWTQVSLTPGADETQMNFAWYSKTQNVKFRVATDAEMTKPVTEIDITGTEGPVDGSGTQYYICHVTAENLTPGTYYYQIDSQTPVAFPVQD